MVRQTSNNCRKEQPRHKPCKEIGMPKFTQHVILTQSYMTLDDIDPKQGYKENDLINVNHLPYLENQ